MSHPPAFPPDDGDDNRTPDTRPRSYQDFGRYEDFVSSLADHHADAAAQCVTIGRHHATPFDPIRFDSAAWASALSTGSAGMAVGLLGSGKIALPPIQRHSDGKDEL